MVTAEREREREMFSPRLKLILDYHFQVVPHAMNLNSIHSSDEKEISPHYREVLNE